METDRYRVQRNVLGEVGQEKLRQSSVLIIGVGGLGAPVATYLCGAGVRKIGLFDFDVVEKSNIHRQVLYREENVGLPKVIAAKNHLEKLNSEVDVEIFEERFCVEVAEKIFAGYDLVIDGTDNFQSKYLINDLCVQMERKLITASVSDKNGMLISVFPGGPCYRCLFPNSPRPDEVKNCQEGGVLGPVPGIVALSQCLEAIKVLSGEKICSSGVILFDFDERGFGFRSLQMELSKDPDCPGCGINSRTDIVEEIKRVSLDDISGNGSFELIDVREQVEFQKGHIRGSKNIPLGIIKDYEFQSTQKYVLYCQGETRSHAAAEFLRRRGVEVKILDGGYLKSFTSTNRTLPK